MPSEFRDPKTLSQWLELDYFERPRKLVRWGRIITWGTFLGCTALVLAIAFWPQAPRLVQAGQLSYPHFMFNDRCSECHTEAFQTAKRFVKFDGKVRATPDSACRQCHEGTRHNSLLLEDEEQNCAVCHREHRGINVILTRVDDRLCICCHADLASHRQGGGVGLRFDNIKSFPEGHEEFRLIKLKTPDPGKLRFNHAVHLKDGGIFGPGGKKEELACATCHVPDAAGRYMVPPRYDAHCARCHPLSVQLAGNFPDDPEIRAAVRSFNAEPAPHGLPPSQLRAALRDRLFRLFRFTDRVLEASEPGDGDGIIDRRIIPKNRVPSVAETEWRWASVELRRLEKALLFPTTQVPVMEQQLLQNPAGCRYCHVEKGREPSAGLLEEGLAPLPIYEKTSIPQRWYTHARFDHKSHRMLSCSECHDAKPSKRTSDVLMPGKNNCQKCHSPAGGARHDCTECHSYHDHSKREINKNRAIEDFLKGR